MQLPFEKEEVKILERKKTLESTPKAELEAKAGKAPKEKTVEELLKTGIVVIDKPPGPTSHNVAHYAKQILRLKKAGHPGTLDPAVTGVLPVALENATKINQVLLEAGKEYFCVMHVHKEIEDEKFVRDELNKFKGKIKQVPPAKSAVKRQEREREVYYLEILEIKGRDVLFQIGCQAGTYIRKVCSDFGENTGLGAHMKELRRTKAGPFNEEHLITLNDLREIFDKWKEAKNKEEQDKYEEELRKHLLPIEKAVEHLPKVWVLDRAIRFLRNGRNVRCNDIVKLTDNIKRDRRVAILSQKNELIAFGPAYLSSEEILSTEKLAINTDRVI